MIFHCETFDGIGQVTLKPAPIPVKLIMMIIVMTMIVVMMMIIVVIMIFHGEKSARLL